MFTEDNQTQSFAFADHYPSSRRRNLVYIYMGQRRESAIIQKFSRATSEFHKSILGDPKVHSTRIFARNILES